MVRPVPAGRRGSCCTPYSRLQEEIDNVETIAVTANNTANNASQLAQQAIDKDTFDDLNVNGDLNVYGDIIQQGAAYETHAQHVFSTDDYIVMRDGALVGLAQGDYSGFQVKKYDGTNDGRLVIDKDGTARVGDVGDEQPLLTRDESADMTDAAPLVWDAANSKAISGVFPVSDPGVASINGIAPDADNDFTIEAGTGVTITPGTNKITIGASGGGSWSKFSASKQGDLFEIRNGNIYSKYEMFIYASIGDLGNYGPFGFTCYIPADVNFGAFGVRATASGGTIQTFDHNLYIVRYITLATSSTLTSSQFKVEGCKITGTLGTDATQSSDTSNLSISSCEIYIKQ